MEKQWSNFRKVLDVILAFFFFFCCHLAARKRRCTDVQSRACIMQTHIAISLTVRGPPYLSVSICCFKTKLFGGCPNSFPFPNFGEVPACLRLPTQTTEREASPKNVMCQGMLLSPPSLLPSSSSDYRDFIGRIALVKDRSRMGWNLGYAAVFSCSWFTIKIT